MQHRLDKTAPRRLPPFLALLLRALLGLAAAGCLLTAWFALPGEVLPAGGRSLEGWWLAMVGLAIWCPAISLGSPWLRSSIVLASLVLGFSGQLYHTTQPWMPFFTVPPLPEDSLGRAALLGLVIEAIAVAATLGPRVLRMAFETPRWLGPLRGLILLACLCLASVEATRYLPKGAYHGYLIQLLISGGLIALHLAALAAVAVAAPLADPAEGSRWRRLEGRVAAELPRGAVLWAFASSLGFAWLALDFHPHLPDEVAYLFQAQTFAGGSLTVPTPPVSEAFKLYLIHDVGGLRWAMPPPGWPAALALGAAVGLPWLINPLLGALGVALAYAYFRRAAGDAAARGVTLLLCVSPWFLLINASLMTHSLTLVLMLSAWLLLDYVRDGASPTLGFAAGLAMGCIVLVRPIEGLVVGTMTGLGGLGLFAPRLPVRALATYAAGCVTAAGAFLIYNSQVTGDPLLFPMTAYLDAVWYPGVNRLGFGADIGNAPGWQHLDAYPGHGWRDVLLNASQNFYGLQTELFGWSCGSLLLAGIFLFRSRFAQIDRRLAVLALALFASYTLYWFSGGNDYGPRYWYLTILPLVWFSVRGAQMLGAAIRLRTGDTAGSLRVHVALAAAGALALGCFVPWRAVGKYDEYRGFHTQYRQLVSENDWRNHLVLVRTNAESDYASAFALMPPDLSGDGPIFALDLGPESNRALSDAFPERPIVVIRGRDEPGQSIAIVEGPLPPGQLPTTAW